MLFGSFSDVPDKISKEGETIVLKYAYEGDGVGRVEWTLPQQVIGCDPDTMAYNGLIITVSNHPVTSKDRPENRDTYISDPSVDPSIHSGDRIGDALVVYDGYGDILTDSTKVIDVKEGGQYYFTAFAVDKQGNYHRAGVAAYSLEYGNEIEQTYVPSYNTVELGIQPKKKLFDPKDPKSYMDGARASEETGLDDKIYCFGIKVGNDDVKQVDIDGANAKTYGDLVNEINRSLINLSDYPQFSGLPNKGTVWFNGTDTYLFDGTKLIKKNTIIRDTDPTEMVMGLTYFDGTELRYWDGTDFITLPFYTYKFPLDDYRKIPNDLILRVDDNFFRWNGKIWCETGAHFQPDRPDKYGIPNGDWVWIDDEGYIWVYDIECKKWIIKDHEIISDVAPDSLQELDIWVDDTNEVMYVMESTNNWTPLTTDYIFGDIDPNKTYEEGTLHYYEGSLDIYESGEWVPFRGRFIVYPAPPSDVYRSCSVWIAVIDDVPRAWLWDSLNNTWVESNYVFSQKEDPIKGKDIPYGDIWFDGKEYRIWDGIDWIDVEVVEYYKDPTKVEGGDHFFDGTDFYIYNMGWHKADVIFSANDPRHMASGTMWYNPTNKELSVWNGLAWQPVMYVEENPTPTKGYEYYNTADGVLYEWNGTEYIKTVPELYSILDVDGNITFLTKKKGSYAFICIRPCPDNNGNNLFTSLDLRAVISKPMEGTDPVSNEPSYIEEGIGTDGSQDERRELIRRLELQLGHPLAIELTKEQFELAITRALETLRTESSSTYERNFMFLDTKPRQQRYILSNKRLGYNRIVTIMSAHRMRTHFFGQAGGNDIYGQALLQQMFHTGAFDLISYELIGGYVKLLNRMFATDLVYTWKESSRELFITQTLRRNERILLDVMTERTEQDIIKDRYLRPWIENFALAQCMYMLAEVRGKYGTLPGAGGGVSLNASDLRMRADALHEKCMDELGTFSSDIISAGTESIFIRG